MLALLLGIVMLGPTTPVCRVGTPCDKPASAVKLTFTRGGHSFAATTDGGGHYRLKLPAGIYSVRASAGMSMRPRAINVHAPTTHLDFAIDTGIR